MNIYRELNKDEIIEVGDEYFTNYNEWQKTGDGDKGLTPSNNGYLKYRRKIKNINMIINEDGSICQ